MKKLKISIIAKGALALLLSFSCVGTFVSGMSVQAEEQTIINETITYDESKKNAVVSFEAASDAYVITKIKNPDDSIQDLVQSKGFTATKNGTYKFIVSYQENGEAQTLVKEVKITDIQTTQIGGAIIPAPALRSSVVNGGVTITIPKYDGVGWVNGIIKEVSISVDFGNDTSSEGKELTVTLPEGMRFQSIPVAGAYDVTGVDVYILSKLGEASDPVVINTESVTIPKKELATMGSTFGDVTYKFRRGMEKATLVFQVRVDATRYYGPKTLENPIRAKLSKGTSPVEALGDAAQTISANGPAVNSHGGAERLRKFDSEGTKQAFVSSATEKSYGYTDRNFLDQHNNTLSQQFGTTYSYYKNATFYIHYPEGMKYEGIDYLYGGRFGDPTITDDPTNSRVVIQADSWGGGLWFRLKYSIPEGMTPKTYANKAKDYADVTYYDDTTASFTRTGGAQYQVVVEDPANFVNQMGMPTSNDGRINNLSEDITMFGPYFAIKNETAGTKTNQVFHLEIDPKWQVTQVNLPWDSTISGNRITSIQYRTSKNSSWSTYTPTTSMNELPTITNMVKQFRKTTVNLASDEYFTEIKANVGSFSPTYATDVGAHATAVNTFGSLKAGVTSVNVIASIYDESNEAATKTTVTRKVHSSINEVKTMASFSELKFYDVDGASATQFLAGETYKAIGVLTTNDYLYGSANIMSAPELYLREAPGMSLAVDTLKFTDINSVPIPTNDWSYTIHAGTSGEKIYKIVFSDNIYVGRYYKGNNHAIRFRYDMKTSVKAEGNYKNIELVAWGKSDFKATQQNQVTPVKDIYDFNNNGNITEGLFSFQPTNITIAPNKKVLVETFLGVEGQEMPPYVDGDASTVTNFTPGTSNAEYTAKITNNGDSAAGSFDVYIPIPKTGQNFGVNFQDEAFKWDMVLRSAIDLDPSLIGKYEVTYSSNATAANFNSSATYTTTPPVNLSDVNMVKMVSLAPIEPGDVAEVKIPLAVDETFETATAGNKIGKHNIYNPVYRVVSPNFTGIASGTKVGTELTIAEIGGTVFLDKNGDGLFKTADGDIAIKDHEVELYKWNELTISYEAVLDSSSNPITTKTNTNGVYLFNNAIGMGYGNYAVKFVEKTGAVYQYTVFNGSDKKINSDAIISDDLPSLGDEYRGWVLDIDPTQSDAKTIGAGFLKYSPPEDLNVSIKTTPNKVKVGESIVVGTTITPDFWESIKNPTTPYTWEIVGDAAEKAKATLTANDDGSVSVEPNALISTLTTFDMKVTVMDVYGNTKTSAAVTISVRPNISPVITASDIDAYVGDTMDIITGVSAVDSASSSIPLNFGIAGNASVSHSIPNAGGMYIKAGTYKLKYTVKDVYDNPGEAEVLVKVSEAPIIKADPQIYTIDDTTIETSIAASVSASWKQAQAVVGEATKLDITGPATLVGGANAIKYEVTGPSTDFSVSGKYEVTYTAENTELKVATKKVDVLVTEKGVITDPSHSLLISGKGFVMTNAEAKDLTAVKAVDSNHANINAYRVNKDAQGNVTGFTEITNMVEVNQKELDAINQASNIGNIYNLSFIVKDGNKEVGLVAKVAVEGVSVPPVVVTPSGDQFAVTAKSFELTLKEAQILDESTAIIKADARAYILQEVEAAGVTRSTRLNTNIKIHVDTTQLSAINNANKNGGEFGLSVTAIYTTPTNTEVKQVVVVKVKVAKESESIQPHGSTPPTGDATTTSLYVFILLLSAGYFIYKKSSKSNIEI